MAQQPLMPKATAVWLVENTALTFDQIADFCGLHALEIQAIADDEVAIGMQGADPVVSGFLTQEEIERCQAKATAKLKISKATLPQPKMRGKGARYTPVSKRQDRPDAIAWLLKHHPEMSEAQIARIIGTTKPTIKSVKERSHWNISNIKPQSPVGLGLCSEADLEKIVSQARRKAERDRARLAKEQAAAGITPVEEAAPDVPEPVAAPVEEVIEEITPGPQFMAPAPQAEEAPDLSADDVFGPAKPKAEGEAENG